MKKILLILTALTVSAAAFAEKITTVAGITSGNKYYIGATTSSTDYYFYADGSSTTQSIGGAAKTDKADAVALTFTEVTGGWTIKFDNGYYLGLQSNFDGGAVQVMEESVVWTIEDAKGLLKLCSNTRYLENTSRGFGSSKSSTSGVWLESAGATPVLATLDSLVIKGKAEKMEYELGEAFDPAGLEVLGIYTKTVKHDSISQIKSGITWTLDPETFEEASDNASVTLVASYKDLTTTDTTITGIKVNAVVPKYTTYENWQLKHEGSEWIWTENLVKVEDGLFKLADANWTGSGFNVKSDENPIKKDWYGGYYDDDPDVVFAEEVIPPVTVDVYLRVIDDETLKIGIDQAPPIQFVDEASGLKFEVTSMEEPRTVKVIFNDYKGTSCTVPGTVTYREKTFDVTEIGVEAFHDCSSLESITLPESVTTLADASLATSGLKSITIPATVTTIGEYAFSECLDLKSVTFQGNACQDTIGVNAFENVGKTTPATLTLPDDWAGSTPENSETPWYGGYFDYTAPGPRVGGKFVDETSGLKFEITSYEETSKTVKVIANSYTGASYDIPETVTNWEVTFDVTEIDAYAFAECHLETFTVPASIVKIGAGAFSNCTSLQSVTFYGNACQNGISVTAFYGVGEDTPATLTLPGNWTGAKPESSILEWFGGFCAIRE